MLSDIAALENSLKVKVLEKTLNKALIINGYLFREEFSGGYIGQIANKGKSHGAVTMYNKQFLAKPMHPDIGVHEKISICIIHCLQKSGKD